ncbi:histidinol dehydrogenase [Methylosinus sp. H3A]|uniref:histidinol dehydrogenase n=1 Tax=Methylosinus sp. H3A TaxID=2785786 RepID=UPI0018C2BB9D|nr:histidinol dehydrogenase [Methylosinus sp. H3A]MBG0811257.1 histidinol dehydrogenase [Methylosinus sp. H3A]
MTWRLDASAADFEERFSALLATKREAAQDVDDTVRGIIEDVAARGDEALIDYSKRFDHIDLAQTGIALTKAEIDAAESKVPKETLAALDLAHARIRAFHERQRPEDLRYKDEAGVELGWRWSALESVGLYVPGGTASYPSSVLMNAVPAKVAGVDRLVMVVPAPHGVIDPLVLAAAKRAGVDEVYRVGGAQAVAALAHGTKTIRPVAKIVGPGNAWVAAAKRRVFGLVGIDMIAGPSEILVLADKTANPDWVAIDLLAQAEHDESAQSILITDDPAFADAAAAAVERQLATLSRVEIASKSWRDYGAIIVTRSLADSIPLADRIAAEHLEIVSEDAEELAAKVRNAGAIFIGAYTPEAIGDYVGGSNHVLPTARSARFSSGLSVLDFVKRTSILKCDPASLRQIGPAAVTLGDAERLQAHARSVAMRLDQRGA